MSIIYISDANILFQTPSMDFINASMDFLHNLGAIDSNENLLGLGSVLAELPVDSIVGKMLIMGVVNNLILLIYEIYIHG
jgi:HrpA-like RNA helicase